MILREAKSLSNASPVGKKNELWISNRNEGKIKKAKRQQRDKENSKNKKRMISRSKSRKTIGPCSSSVQVSTFRRFPMSPLEQKEGTST